MQVQIPLPASLIIDKFQKNGFEIYIVGGAIRDVLMGKPVYDWDFTTDATPEEMLKFLDKAFYDNTYGTVGVPGNEEGERPFEITTFRTECGYSDNRRPDSITWGRSIDEDLKRRDFTINAMALRPTGESKKQKQFSRMAIRDFILIDRYEGQKDLSTKLIRAVGNPQERFTEDALRMMRAIRIASELGFDIEKKTLNAITENSGLIENISKERVRDEFLKILASKNPDRGIILLKDSLLLIKFMPELSENFGVPQASPGRHHIYDVGTHLVMSLKHVSEKNQNPIVRLATLIHDVGKASTIKKLDTGTITFYNHEMVSARIAKKVADRLKLSNADKDRLWKLVRFHQFTLDENQTDSAIRRFIRNVGIENLADMLDLRVGDRLGGGARETSWRLEEFKRRIIEVQRVPFEIKDLKISGGDVMEIFNISSGPMVGKILKGIFDEVESKKIKNSREELLTKLKKMSKLNGV